MIVSVINTKGGVGKTTLSLLLAEALRRTHGSAEVWDLDPQGSALDWHDGAHEEGDPLSFPVQPMTRSRLSRMTPAAHYTIIDTPPGDPQAIDLAAQVSDLVIIPTDASPLDMNRAAATAAALTVPTALLFYRVNVRTRLYAAAREWVEAEDISFFDTVVPPREAAKQAVDTGLTGQLLGADQVAQELTAALTD